MHRWIHWLHMHGYTDYMNTVMNKGIIFTSYTYVNHSEINLALVEIQFSMGFSLLNDRDSNLGVPDKHWRKMWRCTFLWGSIHRARGSSKCKWMMIFWMWLKMGVTFDRRWFCGFSCGSISSSSLKIVKAWRLCFINKTRWEETSKFNQSCHHLLLQFYPCEARHSNLWTSAVKGHWAKLGQVSESPTLCWLRMSRQESVKHQKCCLSRKEHQRTRHWHKKVNIL